MICSGVYIFCISILKQGEPDPVSVLKENDKRAEKERRMRYAYTETEFA